MSCLRRHREGRIGYPTGRGWRTSVVSYVTVPGHVLVQVPDFNDAARFAPDNPVTFEVTSVGSSGDEAVDVEVDAIARRGDDELLRRTRLMEQQWPNHLPTTVIDVPMSRMHGTVRKATPQQP